MKKLKLIALLSILLISSCGSNDSGKNESNVQSGTNTLSINQFTYQYCGVLVSSTFGSGNVLFRNYQQPIRLFPENYSQEIQNLLNSGGKGRQACVASRSEPIYDYGMLTFFVEAVQFL